MPNTLNTPNWRLDKHTGEIMVYTSTKWLCCDNDHVQVHITPDGFELYCFTGMPGAAFFVVDHDALTYVAQTLKVKHDPIKLAHMLSLADGLCDKLGLEQQESKTKR